MIFYIADTHFGHEKILQMDSRPFVSVDEMDRVLIENWNSRVSETKRTEALAEEHLNLLGN